LAFTEAKHKARIVTQSERVVYNKVLKYPVSDLVWCQDFTFGQMVYSRSVTKT